MTSPGRHRRSPGRVAAGACATTVWSALGAALLAGVVVRAAGWESDRFEVSVLSLTPLWVGAAVPVAAVGLWRRRLFVTTCALVTLVAGALWEVPVFWPLPGAPAAVAGTGLRLFDANIAQDDLTPGGFAAEIAADHPDVVTLEELTPQAATYLDRHSVLSGYRRRVLRPAGGAGGVGLWSDRPVSAQQSWTVGAGQFEVSATVRPASGPPVTVDAVHVYAPVGTGQPAEWRRQLAALRAHLASQTGPLVVAGDLNATADMPSFRSLLSLGLSDAAVLRGQGAVMTWPRNQAWVPAYLRLDHVLVSGLLTVTAYRVGGGTGSDHHPLLVNLAERR